MVASLSANPDFRFCPKCGSELARKVVKANEPPRLVCSGCEFILFEDPKLAAGTLFRYEGKLVLLKRAIEPGYGKWVFPGGFVDRGERVVDAAIRETLEESGVVVETRGLIDVYSATGSPIVVVVYRAEIVSGEPRAADETLEVGLFDTSEVPWDNLAFPSTTQALQTYLSNE